jgi:hypothetical protein
MKRLISLALLLACTPAVAHDWYSDKITDTGAPCCGTDDCGPIQPSSIKRTDDGYDVTLKAGDLPSLRVAGYVQSVNGTDVDRPGIGTGPVVFHFKGEPGISPDGQIHGCVWGGDILPRKMRCLFMGGTS